MKEKKEVQKLDYFFLRKKVTFSKKSRVPLLIIFQTH